MLSGLHLLPEEGAETGPLKGTPYGLQVITSGVLTVTKSWGPIIGVMGSAGALAAWRGAYSTYVKSHASVQVAFVIGAAAILVATILGIVVIVRSDVEGRVDATAAQYAAAGRVADTFLRFAGAVQTSSTPSGSSSQADPPASLLAALASSQHLKIRLHGEMAYRTVSGARMVDGGALELKLPDGTWASAEKIVDFTYLRPD